MGVAWTRLGTVSVTAGSINVAGVDTRWLTATGIGDAFQGPDGRWYEVAGVTSDTALQLRTPYQGASAAGQTYAIMRIVPAGTDAVTMAQLQQLLDKVGLSWDTLLAWVDSQDTVSITDGYQTLTGLSGLRKLMVDIAAAVPKAGGVMTGRLDLALAGATVRSAYVTSGSSDPGFKLGFANGQGTTLNSEQGALIFDYAGGRLAGLGFHRGLGADCAALVFDLNGVERLRLNGSGGITSAEPFKPGQYTLATLPAASAYNSHTIIVSNATGGPALCISNGSAWINVRTNAAVS